MILRSVQACAVMLTAAALVPGGAHLLALANKIGLPQDQYFIVQGIYRGWALLGMVLIGALAANVILAVLQREDRIAFLLAAAAALSIALTLVIFFTWTFPANQATDNWTFVPPNWRQLRLQWEYSHAVNAVITFVGLFCVTLSVQSARR
jgi:hypothetical protein